MEIIMGGIHKEITAKFKINAAEVKTIKKIVSRCHKSLTWIKKNIQLAPLIQWIK